MNRKAAAILALSVLAVSGCGSKSTSIETDLQAASRLYKKPTPAPAPGKDEIVVKLSPSRLQRPGRSGVTLDANGIPKFEEPKPVKLVRGEIKVGNENVTFYVPKYGPYSVSADKNHSFDNTSTAISIDSNLDGQINRNETWWSSLPLRLGDKMFDVKSIDPGGSWILLAQSASPLAGVVVGKECPAFTYFTTDGNRVSLADYKGKALLLDVWSMT